MRAATVLLLAAACTAERMVMIGDSWGTEGNDALSDLLKAKNSSIKFENICVGGTTTEQWVTDESLQNAAASALSKTDVEVVWVTLMGNDLQYELPVCAKKGGSTAHCIAKVVAAVTPNMKTIFEFIHSHAPKARIVGFGYDIMGFGKDNGDCHNRPVQMLPRCLSINACFNTHFLALQGVWDDLSGAPQYSYVDNLNLMGSIQVAPGDANATLGSPDLATYSPAAYDQGDCVHPNHKGFTIIFNNLYNMYLKQFEH